MTPNTTNEKENWVHAVANRWDTGCNETFCGITNLKKRKYLVVATDWDSDRVTCPHCLSSPAYRERIAHQMAKRMIEGKHKPLFGSIGSKWYHGTRCTGPE